MPAEMKPFENEHSCRLEDPSKYDRFARKNCFQKHDGKCIDFIFGVKEGKSEVQAMRYNKEVWTEAEAKSHCKDHDGSFEAAKGVLRESTENIERIINAEILETIQEVFHARS